MLNLETAFRPTAKALRLTSLSLAAIMLAACGGSSESSPPSQTVTSTPVPPPPPAAGQEDMTLNTAAKAASFLSKATFGGTQSEIEAAQGKLASEILQNEFAKSPQYILPSLKTAYESGVEIDNRAHASAFWNAMVEGDDQLRQRMVFALSQILVISDDIVGLARVFTGLSMKGPEFWSADEDGEYSRLVMFQDKHSELEKTFMGKTIAAGTAGDAAIDEAIDHIFEHPNLAPFISRQLIQRFTSSNPTPDYVRRVAGAFETGRYTSVDEKSFGTGERGDLEATLAAILLDEQFYDGTAGIRDGKVREPVLRFVHWARAFDVGNVMAENEWLLLYNAGSNTRLGQQPFQSPSVFNFYRPGYVAPGTQSGAAGLTAPELPIVNEGSVIGYANFMLQFVYNNTSQRDDIIDGFVPDYSNEVALAETPEALAEHLNTLLLGGRMNPQTKTRIVTVLNEIPIREVASEADEDKLTRATVAVFMAVTSPAFALEL